MQLLHRLAAACGPGGRLLVGGRAPRHGWLRPLVIRDEYRNLIGPWGGGCRPASQPSSTLPPRPAGASSTPSRMARATGPPSLSTLHDRLPCRLRQRPGDLRSLARSSAGEPRPTSPRVGPLVAVLLAAGICGCTTEAPLVRPRPPRRRIPVGPGQPGQRRQRRLSCAPPCVATGAGLDCRRRRADRRSAKNADAPMDQPREAHLDTAGKWALRRDPTLQMVVTPSGSAAATRAARSTPRRCNRSQRRFERGLPRRATAPTAPSRD
jgi:hypothetical protein